MAVLTCLANRPFTGESDCDLRVWFPFHMLFLQHGPRIPTEEVNVSCLKDD